MTPDQERAAYLWAELVDRVLDWDAVDAAQRRRAETIALLALTSRPPTDSLRDLAEMTTGSLADALRRVANVLDDGMLGSKKPGGVKSEKEGR